MNELSNTLWAAVVLYYTTIAYVVLSYVMVAISLFGRRKEIGEWITEELDKNNPPFTIYAATVVTLGVYWLCSPLAFPTLFFAYRQKRNPPPE